MTESNNERFKRLASSRTEEILKKLDILSNCSNKSTYKYTVEEVDKIFNTIERKIKETKKKFSPSKKNITKFKL